MTANEFRCWDKVDGMKYFNLEDLQKNLVNPFHGVYEVPVMRFTGLKDRKGNKIYEGDIGEGIYATYVVIWSEDKAQFNVKIIKTDSVLIKHATFPLWQYVQDSGECRFEVIGNIHE